MSAIVARQLVKHFAPDIRAVDGIDLDVPEGHIFGFLGQNGSGKTTTVKMLATLLRPTSGTAEVAGINVLTDPGGVRKRIGVAMQEVGLDEMQTGRELMTLQARLMGIGAAEAKRRVANLLDVVTLTEAADRPIKGYSGGMKRRLDLACALVHGPRIIFLDEPTTGLDPITRDAVWRYVQELHADGVTFFLTTQYLEEADRLASDIAIMDSGKIVARGSPAALKAEFANDALSLTFDRANGAVERATELLRGFEGAEEVRADEGEVTVYMRNGAAAVAQVVRALDDAGIALEQLRLTHPTLDDVFVRATGHRLEVDEGGAARPPAARGGDDARGH
ncbi:MAG: ATP-binding cassette domain-containing protein [Dehalococcoidia bacterium]|nr:ATP-binding cassette domain-containing protein [Dehalococcoidia bacterium]